MDAVTQEFSLWLKTPLWSYWGRYSALTFDAACLQACRALGRDPLYYDSARQSYRGVGIIDTGTREHSRFVESLLTGEESGYQVSTSLGG